MSATRTGALFLLLVALAAPAPGAVAPGNAAVACWVRDLASADKATWRNAVERLWKAGRPAEAAVRAAARDPDADVRLRARLVLARFDWSIYPDTPASTARAIERYRDGDTEQRKSVAHAGAVAQLASAWLFKATRTRHRALNLLAQLAFLAPINLLGGLAGILLPRNEDFYLDNLVLAHFRVRRGHSLLRMLLRLLREVRRSTRRVKGDCAR